MAKRLNGYAKWVLIVGLMLIGWGVAWGTIQGKVSSLENDIEMKIDAEVYRVELGYINKKLDKMDEKLDTLVKAK